MTIGPPRTKNDAPNAAGYRWRSVAMGGGGFVSGLVPSRTRAGLWYARTDVGGAYRSTDAGHTWVPLLDWVSDEQTGFLGVESIALDPRAPERVYLLVGISYLNAGKSAVLRSSDFGQSFDVVDVSAQFTAHGNGMGRQSGERLAVDPNDGKVLFTGTRSKGLFKSADYGVSWQRVAGLEVTATDNGNGIAFVIFDAASGQSGGATPRLYVGVSRSGADNVYVSADAGRSFGPVPGQPRGLTPQRAVLSPSGALYVTYASGAGPHGTNSEKNDHGAIWVLDTRSGVWSEITPLRGADNRAFCGISLDAQNPLRLLASTVNTYLQQPWGRGDRIFLSQDGGKTWVDLVATERVLMDTNGFPWIEGHSIHWAGSLELDPFDPERALVVSGNGVFMSENLDAAPATWKFAVAGLEETVPLDAASLPGGPLISVIGDYDGFVHTDLRRPPPAGKHDPSMGTTHALAVAAQKPNVLARVGSELYLSTDAGARWSKVARPTADKNGHLALSADGNVLLWSANSTVHRTADAGQRWTRAEGLTFDAAPAADSVDANKLYAYDPRSGAFYASHDGGQTFQRAATLEPSGAPRIRSVPGVSGEVWVPLHGKGLARGRNAGKSFEPVSSVARCTALGFGVAAPGKSFPAVYMWGAPQGQPSGVYRSDDAGESWLRINDDEHAYGGPGNGQFVFGDMNVYGRVYMSTAGRGIVFGEPSR
jgi:xyloglucan-specific exo-beta-1,4-glucanase